MEGSHRPGKFGGLLWGSSGRQGRLVVQPGGGAPECWAEGFGGGAGSMGGGRGREQAGVVRLSRRAHRVGGTVLRASHIAG